MIWVKICGLRREEDARLAQDLGANALGFVFEPSSPRYVGSPQWAPEWLADLESERVAVFGPVRVDGLSPLFESVQGIEWPALEEGTARKRQPVLRVEPGVLDRLESAAQGAERIVLDAPHPSAYGGTGQTVDWGLAAEIVAASPLPVVLAGGLTPENVAAAIARVHPFGVDVSSGVELAPGVKDPAKLKAFFEAVKGSLPLS